MEVILLIMFLFILILPLIFKRVEEALEVFLFLMGVVTVTITSRWSGHLIVESLQEPVKITAAVFFAGIIFRFIQKPLQMLNKIVKKTGVKLFVFFLVTVLGLLSSVITAIITALILVEIIHHLKLSRKAEIKIAVLTCFSIGFGAVLTPIGEPLSTIIVSKLKGPPYFADTMFLINNLWYFIVPSIFFLGVLASRIAETEKTDPASLGRKEQETIKDIAFRAFKVYIFVMGLIFLGSGFKPLADRYLTGMPVSGIYWINITSSVLDNATLGASEINPVLSIAQIKSAVLSLIISGGMFIPGNIPNIITSGKLNISSKEWAKVGVPLCVSIMLFFYLVIVLLYGF